MRRMRVGLALSLLSVATGGCGYLCPPQNPLGRYGCHVPCEDLPSAARARCVVIADDAAPDGTIDADASIDAMEDARDASDEAIEDRADVGFDALTFVDGAVSDGTLDDVSVDGGDAIRDSEAPMIDPTIEPPRPIAPMTTSAVSSQRPTLRWSNSAMSDGAIVELSRTRAFATVEQTLRVTAGSARPSAALAPGVWFWRLRGTVSARSAEGSRNSPVWSFRVRAANASGDADTHHGAELDVNGDGFSDVAIGVPGANGGRGRVEVYLGSASGLSVAPAITLTGSTADEAFGSSVASAGDVNGDGYGDLIVGANSATVGAMNGAGAASLFLGSASGVHASPQRLVTGVAAGDRFGSAVASVGDVNGDGYGDVAVGAYSATVSGRTAAGAVSIFFGGAAGIGATPTTVLNGGSSGDFFGWSVSSGDVNGDGYSDVVVGAPGVDSGAVSNVGAVTVWHGSTTGVAASAARVLLGGAAQDSLGRSVSAVGDFNNDGFSDVAAGADGADVSGRLNCGVVNVHLGSASGVAASAARTLAGVAAEDAFGWSLAASDVNGDGFSDLIVGAYYADGAGRMDAGSAFVFHGTASGPSATAARRLDGAASFDGFSFAVAGVADVNADGFGDVMIGAFAADAGARRDAGAALLFVGGATGIGASAARTITGSADDDRLGRSLAVRGSAGAPVRWPTRVSARILATFVRG